MGNTVVETSELGKRYPLGQPMPYDTLRDALSRLARAPFQRFLERNCAEDRVKHEQANRFIWALKDVSFSVRAGEVVGIVGRNGSGKTTLLKILSRITAPTEGRAFVRGRVGSLLEVGTGFHPELTGRENIYLSGSILGMTRHDIVRRFDDIVAFSGVERFLDTPVKRYSSGMYVRLGFSVSAHFEPEILFIDEVLAVGDWEFQRKCREKMQTVARQGGTVLFVSHNMESVKAICSRALLFDSGRITRDGTAHEVVEHYVKDGTEMSRTGIVPDDAVRYGVGAARIRRVELLDLSDRPLPHALLGQPFRVAVTVEVRKAIEDAFFEVGISTPDGSVWLATVISVDSGHGPTSLQEGLYTVRLDLSEYLLPAQYTLDVGIHRLGPFCEAIDVVRQALDFEVLPLVADECTRYPFNRAYVRLTGHWHLPKRIVD